MHAAIHDELVCESDMSRIQLLGTYFATYEFTPTHDMELNYEIRLRVNFISVFQPKSMFYLVEYLFSLAPPIIYAFNPRRCVR